MDLQNKPLYGEASCPLCTERKAARAKTKGPLCDRCLQAMPAYQYAPQGFEGHSFSHWHQTQVSGILAGEPVKEALCGDCYLEDFKNVYPDATPPELPPCDVRISE